MQLLLLAVVLCCLWFRARAMNVAFDRCYGCNWHRRHAVAHAHFVYDGGAERAIHF